ncbi:MAG TPA: hypothetical protein VGB45_06135 [Abditibacterium sp.]|jgi:hypothetical protein
MAIEVTGNDAQLRSGATVQETDTLIGFAPGAPAQPLRVPISAIVAHLGPRNMVFGATPLPAPDGTLVSFTTPSNFAPEKTALYLNGLRQKRGDGFDYTENAPNQIIFSDPPFVGDVLVLDYIEAA